ncbi:MAG TPA: hypothetical protein VFV51_08355 [Vicinamibacterales bacterium]|nr:hypothetical protein [Vicinamibacterales bacterium]
MPQRADDARREPRATIVVFAAIVIACIFTYPYIINFSNAGRIDTNDGRWSIWVVSWVAHALTTDPASIFRANIFYPHDNALAFSEGNFIGGVIAIPAWLATGNPYAAHNFFFIATFVLSSVATYYLVRHLTGDWRAAAVCGVLYAYSPFAFARQAHSQLLMIGVLPWAMLAFHRFIDRSSVARAVELGVVLWIAGLACAYYGIFAGGLVGLGTIMLGITRGHWRQPRYWMLVGVAAAVCIGLTAPLFLPYLRMQDTTGFARPLDGSYSANISAWLISSAWAHRWWAPWVADASEVLFPGIVATIFGLWGAYLWRGKDVAWFYITAGLIAFWTTFGPKAGLYTLLYYTVPVFSFLRAPSRTGIVVTLCLVVLAAPALIRVLNYRKSLAAFGILFALAVADTYRAPLRMREAPPLPTVYRTLARLPRGPVIELPFWSERIAYHRHAEYMLDSAYHWQPLINGYSDHIPQDFRDNALPLSGFPSREAFAILEPLGARYAVVHLNLMDARSRESLIERLDREYVNYLRPLEKDGDVWLYEIIAWPR